VLRGRRADPSIVAECALLAAHMPGGRKADGRCSANCTGPGESWLNLLRPPRSGLCDAARAIDRNASVPGGDDSADVGLYRLSSPPLLALPTSLPTVTTPPLDGAEGDSQPRGCDETWSSCDSASPPITALSPSKSRSGKSDCRDGSANFSLAWPASSVSLSL